MISVTILTKNSARHIRRVLEALQSFDEIVLLDNGSTDDTLDIAETFANVRIEKSPFIGFGPLHNRVSALASNDWILSIDSDEVVSPDLAHEIAALQLDSNCVYSFERHTYYRGNLVKCCGWYPDRIIRLYNKRQTQFSDDKVHERVLCEGMNIVPLQSPVWHYSYENAGDFLHKMQVYSDLFAKQWAGQKHSSPLKAVVHAFGAFCRSFFLQKGCFGGYAGMLISFYQAHSAFYKYIKLYEANQDRDIS